MKLKNAFSVWLAAVFVGILVNPVCLAASGPEDNSKPNVLFIAVDDLNDWVEPLAGHSQAITPNLSRLAVTGITFTNAHCQAPICNPSRISLLTGKLPSSTGVYFLSPHLRQCKTTRDLVTLPQYFARNGYETIGGGKIFHVEGPLEFDSYGGRFGGFGPRPRLPINCRQAHPLWDWGAFPDSDTKMPDFKLAEWAVQQIKKPGNRPRFLAVGFYRPHVPMYVPKKWLDRFPLESIKLPEHIANDLLDVSQYAQDLSWSSVAPRHEWFLKNKGQWQKAVQAYLACTAFVDHQVGKLLDALEQSGQSDNTIVVLWSDHGFHLGTKERWGKRSLWNAATRVPLIIRGPGIACGMKCDRPVGLIDLFPTLNDLCGLESMKGIDGRSLKPLLRDPAAKWPYPAITTFGPNNHAIETADWRYITYADGSQELYDRRTDRFEFRNLIGDPKYQPIVNHLRHYLPQINLPMAPGSANLDARPGSEPDIDGKPDFEKMRSRGQQKNRNPEKTKTSSAN